MDIRPFLAFPLFALMACTSAEPSAETIAAERAAVAAAEMAHAQAAPAAASTATAAPQSAAAAPAAQSSGTAPPRIVRQVTREGRIDPECAVTIRYANGQTANNLVALGSCEELNLTLIAVAQLEEMGQLGDLEAFERQDILRSRDGYVLYSESEFTASAYPLNAAGDAYQVALAD